MRHPLSPRSMLAVGCTAALVLGAAACSGDSGGGSGDKPIVGLITKTDTNQFFVKMKEGAQKAAAEQGVELQSFAGKQDGDNEAQVTAIENLISRGAKGFLITPSDSKAIVPSLEQARQQGMLVIALDTPTDPADAADATFATDNRQAGKLIGQWAKAKFDKDGKQAKIAMLDLNANGVSVDVQRDQGFLEGFGIPVGDNNKIGDEKDPRIAGHDVTDGVEDGVAAIAAFAKDGTKPKATEGKAFVDTGATLITDQPQTGVDAKDSAWGKQNCWG